MAFLAAAALLGVLIWLWHSERDPLLELVPFALAFPPLIAYGGQAFGWPGGWISSRKALIGCIGLAAAFRLLRRDFSYRPVPGLRYVSPYLLLVVASVLWSVLGPFNAEASDIGDELVSWAIPIVVFLLIAGTPHDDADLRRAGQALIAVALCETVYTGFQGLAIAGYQRFVPGPIADLTRFGQTDLRFGPQDLLFGSLRLYGTFPNLGPNFFGAFMLIPSVLVFSRAFPLKGGIRAAWFLAGVACVAVIAATYSRGAMLGTVVGLLMLPVWRRSARGLVMASVGVMVIVAVVGRTTVGGHVGSLYTSGQLDVSGRARLYLWQAILRTTAEHPLGLGFNGWVRESRTNVDIGFVDLPASIGSGRPAENQWMRELADRGLLGVVALALLMVGILRITFREAGDARSSTDKRDFMSCAGAACAGWVFVLLTGDHLMYDSVAGIFWYTMALALAGTRPVVGGPVRDHNYPANQPSPGP
jgi:O-antigen ligase/polysaccharide polymerase Wzy-like membrane protein